MRQVVLDRRPPAQRTQRTAAVSASFRQDSRTLKSDLVAFIAVVKRQVWTLVVCVAASLGLAGAYLMIAPPKYTGTASVLTETSRSPSQVTGPDQQGMVDSAVVQSQMAMLNSDGLARKVVARLHLDADPEFSAPGVVSRAMSLLGLSGQPQQDARSDTVLSRFKRALRVTRVDQSYVAEVAFTSRDPQKAATIANAVANAYLDDQLAARMVSAQRANQSMGRWVAMARAEMDAATGKIASFRQAEAVGLAAHDQSLTGKLDALQKAADAKRSAYQAVRTRAERLLQFVENQSVPYTQARIVSEAHASSHPSSPKVSLTVLLACFCGGILGVAVGNIREAFDGKIRTPEQMGEAAKADRVVAVPWPRRSYPKAGADPRAMARYRNGDSAAIWRLRAAVERFAGESGARMLAVVSPREEDGRSVIAAALADAIARSGDRVLLINAHWSKSAGERAGRERTQGAGEAGCGYDVLAVGPMHKAGARPAQLRRLETDLKTVVDQYKYILIDCPAILDHPEMSVALEGMDACIMVAHVARASLADVRDARDMMPFDRDQVIAVPVVARSG